MAYDKEELIKHAVATIKRKKLCLITDVPPYLGIATSTFYNHELEKVEVIKDALRNNCVKATTKMRRDWQKSNNSTLQIAAYKLLATEEEYHRLANTKLDVTTREEVPIFKGIDLNEHQEPKDEEK